MVKMSENTKLNRNEAHEDNVGYAKFRKFMKYFEESNNFRSISYNSTKIFLIAKEDTACFIILLFYNKGTVCGLLKETH